MSTDESYKAINATKFSGTENLTMVKSQQTTSPKKSIDSAANSNVNNSNSDDDRTKPAQFSHTAISTNVAPSPNPVVGDQRQSASSAKRVIRKVMVIDPKKLQEAGLDRKLAEAIGRQKLKALAKEQKKNTQNSESINLLSYNPNTSNAKSTITLTSTEGTLSTIKTTSAYSDVAATVATTCAEASTSTIKTTPVSVSINLLSNNPNTSNAKSTITLTSTEGTLSTIKTTSAYSDVAATVATTCAEASTSTIKTTPVSVATIKSLATIKKLETVKNVLLKLPATEITPPTKFTASVKSPTPDNTVSISPARERKVFVTPKITITRPGEEISPLRIIPEHRLENVKYILNCKILKRLQLAAKSHQTMHAHQAIQTLQPPTASTSLHLPSQYQTPLIEPKAEEFIRVSKPTAQQKPSPAKTPQDIARALDFSPDVATVSTATAAAVVASESKVEKESANDSLRIKNYSLYAPKASSSKAETLAKSHQTMHAHQAIQTLQPPTASTSLHLPSQYQTPLIEPKAEEFIRVSKPTAQQKPSPAKTPQDIARALDFSPDVATVSTATAAAVVASESKVEKESASDSLRIKNYSLYAPKASSSKAETLAKSHQTMHAHQAIQTLQPPTASTSLHLPSQYQTPLIEPKAEEFIRVSKPTAQQKQSPAKTPQDIARALDFSPDVATVSTATAAAVVASESKVEKESANDSLRIKNYSLYAPKASSSKAETLAKSHQTMHAHQAIQTLQPPTASTSLHLPSQYQTPLIEPKAEEFIRVSKPTAQQKPSPAKTPQDIARALDFSPDVATVSTATAAAVVASESKVEKESASDSLRIKNYSLYAPKASSSKAETLGTRAIDVARLVARIGNTSNRKDLDHPSPKAVSSKRADDIPKATIICKSLPVEIKHNEASTKKVNNSKKNTTDTPQAPKLPTDPLPTLKNVELAAANKTVKLVYKTPVKRPTDNGNGEPSPTERNAKQHHKFVQLKDFAALKQPSPVVINPQDSSLSPNTTLKIVYKALPKQLFCNENSKTSSAELHTQQRNEHTQLKKYTVFSSLKQIVPAVTQSHDLSLPSNKTVKLVYRAPPKQALDNDCDKSSIVDTNTPLHNELLQFKDFPAFSPLKHPFPVVTHSQDLPLPTISTLKKPFPTTLIKVGKIGQLQNNSLETPRPENSMVTDAEEARPSQPLIVLENKVLSQDEKIDLTALGLGTPKIEQTSEMHAVETKETLSEPCNTRDNKEVSQSQVASTSTSSLKNILSDGYKLNTILSMDKLQLSAEKIAGLVNFIKAKKGNSNQISVVRKIENVPTPNEKSGDLSKSNPHTNAFTETLGQPATTFANEDYSTLSTRSSESPNIPAHSQFENNLITPTSIASTSYELKAEPLSDPESQSDTEIQFKNPLPRNTQKMLGTDQFGGNKSAVCVIDSGDESDVSISAVDFIASLAAEHPITEDMKLELSPEELNLNASFASNFSPLRIPNRDRTESKSEITEHHIYEAFNSTGTEITSRIFHPETVSDDVQIGKIITISDGSILKAIAASKISNEEIPTVTHEVFKLTKSTEFLDRAEEEAQVSQSEKIHDLDIANTDHLAESALGPTLVSNIEIGVLNNFDKLKSSPVLVKNIEDGTTACFGKMGESEDAAVVGAAFENSSDNDRVSIQPPSSTLEGKTTGDKEFIWNRSTFQNVKSNQRSTCVQESKEMSSTENTKPKPDQMENSQLSRLLYVDGNIEPSEKKPLVEEETSSASTKRLPRFKKGKVNLVKRKKTTVTAQETKEANVSEIVKKVRTDQKEIPQASVIKEIETLTGENSNDRDLKLKSFPAATSNMEVNSVVLIKQTTCFENSETSNSSDFPAAHLLSEIPVQAGHVSTKPLLKSSDLKRKNADISELLHPSKMPKQKSAGAEVNPANSSNYMSEQKMNNILVAEVKAATAETELTPAKKANIEESVSEKSVKGIQNLLTKINEGNEQLFGESEATTGIIEKTDISAKCVDVSKLAKEQLGTGIVESSAKDPSKFADKADKATKHNVEENATQNLQKNAENTSERLSFAQKEKLNANIAIDTEEPTTAEVNIVSNDCDNVNVIGKDKLEVNTTEDIEGDAKLKSDFLGFDHSSPSTHNIESNLQHILTITNSAEVTKTRDENYSTADRESPHAVKKAKKSWLAADKTTPKKSKFGQVRKSSNRRSVPLKKRWGVIRESDDDIDITDDTSPADDDADDDKEKDCGVTRKSEEANSTQIKEVFENHGEQRKPEFVKCTEKQVVPNDITETASGPTTSLTARKKRDKSPRDGTDARKHATAAVNVSESTSSSAVETPNKKIRLGVEFEAATKAIMSKESPNEPITNIPDINDAEDPTNIPASNVSTRRSCSRASGDLEASTNVRANRSCSRASVGLNESNEEATKKPEAKRGRKSKAKIEFSEATEIMTVAGMETAQAENKSQDTLVITGPAIDSNQIANTKDLIGENEIGNTKSQTRQKRSNKFEVEETVVKETGNESGQPKSGKKRGRPKTKVADAAESVSPHTSKEIAAKEKQKPAGRKSKTVKISTSIPGVQMEEEFVKIEFNVPSIFEMEVIQEALGKSADSMARKQAESKSVDSLGIPNQKLATSTPSSAHLPDDGAKKARRRRKSLGEIDLNLVKDQTENETVNRDEGTPIVAKKRGRKPKSVNVSLLSRTESPVCNSVAEPEKGAASASDYIRQESNGAKPESSINTTEANDSTANVSQATAELITPVKIPKKRGRKPKALLATPETLGEEQPSNPPAKKGRAKGVDLETRGTFNERLLLVTNRIQLDTDEVLTAEPVATTSNTKNIVCGFCLQQMIRDTWLDHLATHYGVGWIVGETTPINVTIRNEVLKAMAAFLKITAGRYPLTCRMCQRTFRSALGALLHIELCGATDTRVPCDYCDREYSKLSVANHMRDCSQRIMNKREEANSAGDTTEIKEAVFNNVGRMKRASVQKAEKILKAIGSASLGAGVITIKDAKNYIKLVPAVQFENIADEWTKDLESLGKAHCSAPNCSFESQELTTLQAHFKSCGLKETVKSKGVYICQLCADSKKSYNSSKLAVKHVLKHHKHKEDGSDFEADVSDCGIKTDDESSGDDDDLSSGVDSNEESNGDCSSIDEGEARKNVSRRKSRKKPDTSSATNTAIMERLHPQRNPNFSSTVPELWKEYISQNYSTQPLFADIKDPNYTICARVDYEQYLPRTKCSMKFNWNPKLELTRLKPKTQFGKMGNMEWSQLQRFEVRSEKNDHFIFIGEAIKIVSWVPLPANIREQYLLITTRREYTRYKNPKIGNTLLWLYKVMPPNALEPFNMQLHYAINIPDGPVHCLAFLPSGGYDATANRLGLVAIGTPTSTIKVYALPLTVAKESTHEPPLIENPEQILQGLTTIQLQPVFLLTLDISKDDGLSTHPFLDTQCSSLCWSEFSEHKHIFAGFANGCVSYWDLSSDMNLNRFLIDGVPNYVPINFFYTREKNVRALALHYDTSGVRVLAISVGRRLLFFYDLLQFDRPLLLKQEIARSEVMDLEWSPIWQTMAVAVTDTLSNIGQCVYAVGPTNIAFKNETIDKTNGVATQIHYNPLQHIFANSTDNGDVVLLNLREMYLKEIVRDRTRNTRAVAIMDVKSLKGEDIPRMDPQSIPPDWSFFEADYAEKYGLVFGPLTKIEKIHKPQYLSEQRRPPINLIRCTRINGLRWNNNVLGKKLLALGYENGFLRLLNIERNSYLK